MDGDDAEKKKIYTYLLVDNLPQGILHTDIRSFFGGIEIASGAITFIGDARQAAVAFPNFAEGYQARTETGRMLKNKILDLSFVNKRLIFEAKYKAAKRVLRFEIRGRDIPILPDIPDLQNSNQVHDMLRELEFNNKLVGKSAVLDERNSSVAVSSGSQNNGGGSKSLKRRPSTPFAKRLLPCENDRSSSEPCSKRRRVSESEIPMAIGQMSLCDDSPITNCRANQTNGRFSSNYSKGSCTSEESSSSNNLRLSTPYFKRPNTPKRNLLSTTRRLSTPYSRGPRTPEGSPPVDGQSLNIPYSKGPRTPEGSPPSIRRRLSTPYSKGPRTPEGSPPFISRRLSTPYSRGPCTPEGSPPEEYHQTPETDTASSHSRESSTSDESCTSALELLSSESRVSYTIDCNRFYSSKPKISRIQDVLKLNSSVIGDTQSHKSGSLYAFHRKVRYIPLCRVSYVRVKRIRPTKVDIHYKINSAFKALAEISNYVQQQVGGKSNASDKPQNDKKKKNWIRRIQPTKVTEENVNEISGLFQTPEIVVPGLTRT